MSNSQIIGQEVDSKACESAVTQDGMCTFKEGHKHRLSSVLGNLKVLQSNIHNLGFDDRS